MMTIDMMDRILHVLLWVCIILNGWCVWRYLRIHRKYQEAIRMLCEQSDQLREVADAYEEARGELMKRLAEEQKDD